MLGSEGAGEKQQLCGLTVNTQTEQGEASLPPFPGLACPWLFLTLTQDFPIPPSMSRYLARSVWILKKIKLKQSSVLLLELSASLSCKHWEAPVYKLMLRTQARREAKQLIRGTCQFFYLLVQMLPFSQ